MRTDNRRGSALILVLIASLFLIILTAGAFRYFQTSVDSQIWTRDRIQAKLSAEAGVNLATHYLMGGASLPTDSTPAPILGTEMTPFVLPGDIGSVYATVDPSNENDQVTTANAYMIRCVAYDAGEEEFGIEAIVMPENLARFSVFMDEPSLDGYYGDGYRFDGPFYANGPIAVFSYSATHENDVFFYSLSLTSDHYAYSTFGPGVSAYAPAIGNLEMRPYERLCLGAPYFEMSVDTIPFGSDELDWQAVRSAAQAGGLYLNSTDVPNGSRLALKNDTLFVRPTAASTATAYDLASLVNSVVWIENSVTDRFYLRSNQLPVFGLNMGLTIATIGNIYMSGPLYYENMDPEDPHNTDMLGLMTVNGNLIIADDPGPEPAWGSESFQITTDDSLTYCGVLVSLDGVLRAEDHWAPTPTAEFRIMGGYMIKEEGYTGSSSTGFNMGVHFDPRLLYMHPPFFPTTGNWQTTMWGERPNMTAIDVTHGIPEY